MVAAEAGVTADQLAAVPADDAAVGVPVVVSCVVRVIASDSGSSSAVS